MAAGMLGCKPAAFFVVLQNFRFRFRFVVFAHYEKGLETRRILHFRVRRLIFRLWKFGIATRQKVCNFAPKGSVLPSALCNSTILNSRFIIRS